MSVSFQGLEVRDRRGINRRSGEDTTKQKPDGPQAKDNPEHLLENVEPEDPTEQDETPHVSLDAPLHVSRHVSYRPGRSKK